MRRSLSFGSLSYFVLWSCHGCGNCFFVHFYLIEEERNKYGHITATGTDGQRLSVRLHPDRHAGGLRPVLQHPDPLRPGALLGRGYAPRLRRLLPAGRQAVRRNELLPGSGYRRGRPGGYWQHRRRLRRHPGGWPWRPVLDVDHRVLRHGHHLLRSGLGPGNPCGRRGRQRGGRPRLLHPPCL